MTVINLLPIGVPDQTPEPRGRKGFEEILYDRKNGEPLKL